MSINRYISTPNSQLLQQISTNTQGIDVSFKSYVALEINTSKSAGDLSAAIVIGESKNVQIVGSSSTNGRIGLSYESVNGFYTEGIFATTYFDGSNYQFNLIMRDIPSKKIKILYQTDVSNLNLSYCYY
jgi:hypothetical protein